jgi:uncharacterized protein (TIGR02757 family)
MRRPSGGGLGAARAAALRPLLDAFDRRFDRAVRLRADPVELPRRYRDPGDQEVAGLFAAALAYGRADLFKPRVERVLAEMGPSPAAFCERFARGPWPAFDGFVYRFHRAADLRALAAAVGHVRAAHGSLGERFAALWREEGAGEGALRAALARLGRELREAPPVAPLLAGRGGRGLAHLLTDASLPGPCKRWNLYLRWMVRGPDEVDLGAWRGVPRSALVVPLDTHLARVARHLGLTRRTDASWRTAEEITRGLRRLDPDDPVRFDFALCHLGMSGACPLRRDPARCARCPLREGCVSAARDPVRAPAPASHTRRAPPPPAAATRAGSSGG